MHTQTIYIDLTPGSINPIVHVSQYDTGALTLEFILVRNGATITPDVGSVVVLSGVKPDMTSFSFRGSISGFVIRFNCDQQMTNIAGDVTCELSVTNSEGTVGTANFTMNVEKSPIDRTIISQTQFPSLAAYVSAASEAASRAMEAAAELDSITSVTRIDTASANLNLYTENGTWYAPYSVVNNASSSNFPHPKIWNTSTQSWVDTATTYPGWLHVMASSGYVKQLYYSHGAVNSTDYYLWERLYDGSTWGSWYRLLTEQEISNTLSNTIYKIPAMSLVYAAQQTADGKAPILHSSNGSTYGLGTSLLYGHNRIIDDLNHQTFAEGLALSARQGYVLDQKVTTLTNGKAPNNHRSQDTTYGLGSEGYYGHVKLVTNLNYETAADAGMALHAHQGQVLKGLIDAHTTSINNLISRVDDLDDVITMTGSEDLDQLDYGLYFCQNSNVAKSMSHRPITVTGSFMIYVEKYGWSGKKQVLHYPTNKSFYYRILTNSNADWQQWQKVTGTEVDYAVAN